MLTMCQNSAPSGLQALSEPVSQASDWRRSARALGCCPLDHRKIAGQLLLAVEPDGQAAFCDAATKVALCLCDLIEAIRQGEMILSLSELGPHGQPDFEQSGWPDFVSALRIAARSASEAACKAEQALCPLTY